MDADAATRRAFALRVGGGLLLIGTLAWLLLAGLHGDLPGTGEEVLAQASGALWRPVHILTIVAIALVATSVALLSGTLLDARAAVVGRVGAMIAVPAGAVLGVGFAIGGFVLSTLADAYAMAPDEAARTMHVMQADLVLTVIGATSFAFQTLLGVAIVVLSVATFLSREFPRWHCWLGMIGGAIWCVAGILSFAGVPEARFWLVYAPVVPGAVWLLGFGWMAWRQGSQAPATMRMGMSPSS
jgi:hypothetical protein